MRLTGVRNGLRTTICRLFPDGTVTELAEATEFYADLPRWTAVAATASGGDRRPEAGEEVPAVPPAARVLCAGLNYRLHAEEAGLRIPEHPAFFGRWTASLVAGGVPVPVPVGEPGLDWEVELAVVIGAPIFRATPDEALADVLGYAVFNDLSAREHQMHSRLWTLGKNADRSGPISPIVTADEVGDPRSGLRLSTRVNGEVVQDGSTADMIFSVGEILAYLSEVMTLDPGDVVATGTPQGVGFTRTPPRYLGPGDVVEARVDGVGAVANPIVATGARGRSAERAGAVTTS
jgi:2,4-diketo-3-deoxy-L-fuconate hydrolase